MTQRKIELELAHEFRSVLYSCDIEDSGLVSKLLSVWKKYVEYIVNFHHSVVSCGTDSPLWEIYSWVYEINDILYELEKYEELIEYNQDILKLEWRDLNGMTDELFHENAKRQIADAYSLLGNGQKAIELYESYLEKDSLWGFGWLGYCWVLEEYDNQKYLQVVEELTKRIYKEDFRDKQEVLEWLTEIVK